MASLYNQSIPVFIKYLKNLSGLLDKAVTFADEKGMKHEEILQFRLIGDMQPITYQVQSCCNTAKWVPVRVGGTESVFFEDNEQTFEQLQARITQTIELLKSVDAHVFAGKDARELVMESKMGKFKFESGQTYISEFAIPNFHFHLTSAYCILRHLGVPVGAVDYLGKDTFKKL